MTNSHEVISAFLDDRAVELHELAAALEEPEGRALLIDALALRRLVQPSEPVPSMSPIHAGAWSRLRPAVAAAVLVGALAGGYVLGVRQVPAAGDTTAPAPTRVVEATSSSGSLPGAN